MSSSRKEHLGREKIELKDTSPLVTKDDGNESDDNVVNGTKQNEIGTLYFFIFDRPETKTCGLSDLKVALVTGSNVCPMLITEPSEIFPVNTKRVAKNSSNKLVGLITGIFTRQI